MVLVMACSKKGKFASQQQHGIAKAHSWKSSKTFAHTPAPTRLCTLGDISLRHQFLVAMLAGRIL